MIEICVGNDIRFDDNDRRFSCGFYCATPQGAFPGTDWRDHAGWRLEWWAEALTAMRRSQMTRVLLILGDGSYWLELTGNACGIRVEFKSLEAGAPHLLPVLTTFSELSDRLRAAAQALSEGLRGLGRDNEAKAMEALARGQ